VIWLKADFGELRGAKAAALEFLEREERLDILGEFLFFFLLAVLLFIHRRIVNNAAQSVIFERQSCGDRSCYRLTGPFEITADGE